jgi:anti-anti-sigma factor
MDPRKQQNCYTLITSTVLRVLRQMKLRTGRDVVGLATGDGVALNFKTGEPDLHLRVALNLLEELAGRSGRRVDVRIGLSTHIDSVVTDAEGNEHIVGVGINQARRVSEMGEPGHVLMTGATWEDLREYERYAEHLRDLGEHELKPGTMIRVAQYFDPADADINDEQPAHPVLPRSVHVDLSEIRRQRVKEHLVKIALKGSDSEGLDDVYDFLEDFLDEHGIFQDLKVAVLWVASEMLDNVFKHGRPADDEALSLTIDLTKSGVLLTTEQPDVPKFRLRRVLSENHYHFHFLSMMNRRGLRLVLNRADDRMRLECEIPRDLELATFGPAAKKSRVGDVAVPRARTHGLSFEPFADNALLMKLTGSIRSGAAEEMMEVAGDSMSAGVTSFVVECSEVDYVASSGIAAIFGLMTLCAEVGGQLIIMTPSPRFQKILQFANLTELLTCVKNRDEALDAIWQADAEG